MPWIHGPELLFSGFMGSTPAGTYWGPNDFKLQSEYLGLPVAALAILGAFGPRRRTAAWLLVIAALFLLVALGSGTPFYHLWWAVVPYVSKTRAPESALYLVAFVTSVLAAFGAERLERGEGKGWVVVGLMTGCGCALLALVGAFGAIATSYAHAHQEELGVELVRAAAAAQPGIVSGALTRGVALAAVAGVALLFQRRWLTGPAFAVALVLLVGADLWHAGRGYWQWSRPESGQLAADDLIQRVAPGPRPLRVCDYLESYPSDALMAHDIAEMGGYHGNELQAYDDLWGADSEQADLRRLQRVWTLLAVRYVISPAPDTVRIPGFHEVLGPVRTGMGRQVFLYEADSVVPYARVVPAAVRVDPAQIVPTLLDPRTDYDRVVLFTPDQPVAPAPLAYPEIPRRSASRATVTRWAPGRMSIRLDPAPTDPSYLLVSENWYPDWHARVDGDSATVLRGDQALITVPVGAGARRVELVFDSADYRTGRRYTLGCLIVLACLGAAPRVLRRRRA